MSDCLQPHGLYIPWNSLYCLWNSQGQNTQVGSLSLLQEIFPTQIASGSPTLQVGSLPAEPQGKPKNTGVGSLSLLQQIFLTQESNLGLLHCRWILYQLNYEGSQLKPDRNSKTTHFCTNFWLWVQNWHPEPRFAQKLTLWFGKVSPLLKPPFFHLQNGIWTIPPLHACSVVSNCLLP